VARRGSHGSHEFYEQMGAVIRQLRAVASQAYAEIGIGSAQAKCLRHIGRNSRISQADLARAIDTAPTLTGRALEPLIERGWVTRKRSEEDRREYVLELSASGQRMRERVEEARERIIQRIAKVLDARDLEDFARIATKILEALDGAAESPPARARR
jgi:DNA-binding MarR family transcriptional regulator